MDNSKHCHIALVLGERHILTDLVTQVGAQEIILFKENTIPVVQTNQWKGLHSPSCRMKNKDEITVIAWNVDANAMLTKLQLLAIKEWCQHVRGMLLVSPIDQLLREGKQIPPRILYPMASDWLSLKPRDEPLDLWLARPSEKVKTHLVALGTPHWRAATVAKRIFNASLTVLYDTWRKRCHMNNTLKEEQGKRPPSTPSTPSRGSEYIDRLTPSPHTQPSTPQTPKGSSHNSSTPQRDWQTVPGTFPGPKPQLVQSQLNFEPITAAKFSERERSKWLEREVVRSSGGGREREGEGEETKEPVDSTPCTPTPPPLRRSTRSSSRANSSTRHRPAADAAAAPPQHHHHLTASTPPANCTESQATPTPTQPPQQPSPPRQPSPLQRAALHAHIQQLSRKRSRQPVITDFLQATPLDYTALLHASTRCRPPPAKRRRVHSSAPHHRGRPPDAPPE